MSNATINANTDAMVSRLEQELEERNAVIEGLVSAAQESNRDLSQAEMDLVGNAQERIAHINAQLGPLRESYKIAVESRRRTQELNQQIQTARAGHLPSKVEYRSAGVYIADLYLEQMGEDEAKHRLEVFHRAAAHQTTSDNAGLLPEQIVLPVLNYVDTSRPLVSALGPQDLGTGSWAYAKVTQHTLVGAQSAEKAEMSSRKMTITKTSITAPLYGGYVNVSKQDIRRTSPQILDMIINDLAGQYAIETEDACGTDLVAGGTTATTPLPLTPDATEINATLWAAVAQSYTATQGQGGLLLVVSPDQMATFGPLFVPVNPQNAASTGFNAGSFGSGVMGSISGIPVVMSPPLAAGTRLLVNTSAVKLFEARYGAMQVNEPSVWGVQVGYAGEFETVIAEAGGVIVIEDAGA
jgi:HK97 family phage major capsid protein